MTRALGILSLLVVAGCGPGASGPVDIALGQDACAHCRMTIAATSTAAEIVAPGDEPLLFDDIGCLRDYLAGAAVAPDAIVYVADHRTGAWVEAAHAVFTATSVSTPMASGLLAHADTASRDADSAAREGSPVDVAAVVGHRAEGSRP